MPFQDKSIYIQQQTAAFSIAPSITPCSLIRVFQRLLRGRGACECSPAHGSGCPQLVVHHVLPLSLTPRTPREGKWGGKAGARRAQPSCSHRGWQWAAAPLHISPVRESSYSMIQMCGAKQTQGMGKPAKTRKVISPVTATNWNHDVSGGGDDCIINKWQGSICGVDEPH